MTKGRHLRQLKSYGVHRDMSIMMLFAGAGRRSARA